MYVIEKTDEERMEFIYRVSMQCYNRFKNNGKCQKGGHWSSKSVLLIFNQQFFVDGVDC